MRHLMLACAAGLCAAPAAAQNAALLLGTNRYETLEAVPSGSAPVTATDELEAQGYRVRGLRNPEAAEAVDSLNTLAQRLDQFDRVIVTLSGQFVTDGVLTWYLTTEAEEPMLFGMGESAIPLQSVLQVLARRPGESLLLLGTAADDDTYFGDWLEEGIGTLDVPQGVTVLAGPPLEVAEFLSDRVASPGTDVISALRRDRDIRSLGAVPDRLVLTSGGPTPAERAEAELWAEARRQDTLGVYADYLERYPLGRFAEEAEQRIDALLSEPYRSERLAEEALELTRAERRAIQRDLSALGYYDRAIDGIFGAGTRRAVAEWQRQTGLEATSYLTAAQIDRLGRQVAQRRAEQRQAEERERQQAERRERAYWDETGARGTAEGYRAYLDRYPQGRFAETARQGLDRIAEERRQAAAEADRRAWRRAQEADRIAAYRRYLNEFPEGRFRDEARERIRDLRDGPRRPTDAELAEAREAEEDLGLNPITTRLVEDRLRDLGLNPGPVDSDFEEATRRAIRAYQRQQNLPVTGYLSEQIARSLLDD